MSQTQFQIINPQPLLLGAYTINRASNLKFGYNSDVLVNMKLLIFYRDHMKWKDHIIKHS